jgi:hypothetical protein
MMAQSACFLLEHHAVHTMHLAFGIMIMHVRDMCIWHTGCRIMQCILCIGYIDAVPEHEVYAMPIALAAAAQLMQASQPVPAWQQAV